MNGYYYGSWDPSISSSGSGAFDSYALGYDGASNAEKRQHDDQEDIDQEIQPYRKRFENVKVSDQSD